MDLELKGRKAFVTGASRGIGHEVAKALAAEGVHLALFGRDEARCGALANELHTRYPGQKIVAAWHDFEKPESIKPAVDKAARELGGVDILVNCAGGAYRGKLGEIPDDAWERYFLVKPFGLVRMTRETIPYLRQSDQARIINFAGTRGREPEAHSMMSGPINLGTLSLTKAMANEFGPDGITVNAINPGSTRTRRWDELVQITMERHGMSASEAERHLLKEVPLGKAITTEAIADLVLFLASARAALISGCAINVDGGRTRSI